MERTEGYGSGDDVSVGFSIIQVEYVFVEA